MQLFYSGIGITETEHYALLHVQSNPEQWLENAVKEKARLRRNALITEWLPRLLKDTNTLTLPANVDEIVQVIQTHPDYKSRLQIDAEQIPPEPLKLHNTRKFVARKRTENIITLCPTGITLSVLDYDCILAYVQDVEDWVLGALLGMINRGTKKMIRQYQQVLWDDSDVTMFPANEDDLIQVIVQRDDYKTLPVQVAESLERS